MRHLSLFSSLQNIKKIGIIKQQSIIIKKDIKTTPF